MWIWNQRDMLLSRQKFTFFFFRGGDLGIVPVVCSCSQREPGESKSLVFYFFFPQHVFVVAIRLLTPCHCCNIINRIRARV